MLGFMTKNNYSYICMIKLAKNITIWEMSQKQKNIISDI